MIVLLIFAFISGLVTIFAPCIWPLLPIVLSASGTGGHRKPLGITVGILTTFTFFNLTISYYVSTFNFDPNILRVISVGIIGLLGLTLLIPQLSRVLESMVSRLSSKLGGTQQINGGFWQGFLTGMSLGIVWTPCAGPILATITTLAATQRVTTGLILVSITYSIGVGIPLFIFSYIGNRVITKTRLLNKYTGRIQQVFGIIMILMAFAIYNNYDKALSAKLSDLFPSYSTFLNQLESNPGVKEQLDKLQNRDSSSSSNSTSVNALLNEDYPAPEITGITKWLNPEKALSLSDLKGKVVLIDFWTYTCINCIRTLPHVTSWYDKYHDKGFTVIGVHTPEFEFEKNTQNVLNAIKQFTIHYPVAQDNNFSTWNAFNNQYWPAEYLIDSKGVVRRTHFGEGEYEEMEKAIQTLLKEAGASVSSQMVDMPDQTPHEQISPETYLGARRMQYFFPNGSTGTGKRIFSLSHGIDVNSFSLGGDWNITAENAISGNNAVLEYSFTAGHVFLVLRPGNNASASVKVFLDGKPILQSSSGADVKDGVVTVDTDRLYDLVNLHGKYQNHLLRLEFLTPGTEAFAFTFG